MYGVLPGAVFDGAPLTPPRGVVKSIWGIHQLKLFSSFIQTFCFEEPVHKSKQIYHCQNGAASAPLLVAKHWFQKNLVIDSSW